MTTEFRIGETASTSRYLNSNDKQSTHQFQKLAVQIPDDVVIDSRGTIAFRYESSDPAKISGNPLTGYEPAEGRIRIWKKGRKRCQRDRKRLRGKLPR